MNLASAVNRAVVAAMFAMTLVLAGLPGAGADAPGDPRQLSDELPSFGGVLKYGLTPDLQTVFYAADAFVDGQFELFTVAVDGGEVTHYELPTRKRDRFLFITASPDSTRLVAQLQNLEDESRRLYSVSLTGGATVELDAETGIVSSSHWGITEDSTQFVYGRGDVLVTVPLAGGAIYELGPYDTGAPPVIVANDVVFWLFDEAAGTIQLVRMSAAGGSQTALSREFDVTDDFYTYPFRVYEGMGKVVFVAPGASDTRSDVWIVPIDGGQATKLYTGHHGNPHGSDPTLSPDGRFVLFRPGSGDSTELLSVPAGGGAAVSLTRQHRIGRFAITADGETVVFATRPGWVIYSTPIDGGSLTTLSDDSPHHDDAYLVALHGDRVLYQMENDNNTDDPDDLYSSPVDGSEPPVKLSTYQGEDMDMNGAYVFPDVIPRVLMIGDFGGGSRYILSVPVAGGEPIQLLRMRSLHSHGILQTPKRLIFTAGPYGWNIDPRGDLFTMPVGHWCGGRLATIHGSNEADEIVGTPGEDVINGLGGDDVISGKGGPDIICAGKGDDTVFGGAGADAIFGQSGRDLIKGGTGDDAINAGPGADEVWGSGGSDLIYGKSGGDLLHGKKGSDLIYGGGGPDDMRGGGGEDECHGGGGTNEARSCETVTGSNWP